MWNLKILRKPNEQVYDIIGISFYLKYKLVRIRKRFQDVNYYVSVYAFL